MPNNMDAEHFLESFLKAQHLASISQLAKDGPIMPTRAIVLRLTLPRLQVYVGQTVSVLYKTMNILETAYLYTIETVDGQLIIVLEDKLEFIDDKNQVREVRSDSHGRNELSS